MRSSDAFTRRASERVSTACVSGRAASASDTISCFDSSYGQAHQFTMIIDELNKVTENVKTEFGGLNAEQLNWRVSEDSWSVGQCLDHLIKTNELFFGEFDKIAAGSRQNSFWENWSPFTKMAGNFLIKTLKSDEKKVKAPSQSIVPPSEIEPAIVAKFAAHQSELCAKIESIGGADPDKTVVTSPFMGLMTYTLGTGLEVIVEHEKRHFRQAARVMKSDRFPA
jgi:hypothetical protein